MVDPFCEVVMILKQQKSSLRFKQSTKGIVGEHSKTKTATTTTTTTAVDTVYLSGIPQVFGVFFSNILSSINNWISRPWLGGQPNCTKLGTGCMCFVSSQQHDMGKSHEVHSWIQGWEQAAAPTSPWRKFGATALVNFIRSHMFCSQHVSTSIHNYSLGGGFKYFLILIPTWGKIPILTIIFSNGSVQPPTSSSQLLQRNDHPDIRLFDYATSLFD